MSLYNRIENGEALSEQEVFSLTYNAVMQQAHLSADGDKCLLHAPNGSRCAVGQWVSDSRYHPNLEVMPAAIVIEDCAPSLVPHIRLLRELQSAHDDSYYNAQADLDTFKMLFTTRAQDIATTRQLEFTPA